MLDVSKFAGRSDWKNDRELLLSTCSKEEAAKVFRDFADQVENGNILLHKVQGATVVDKNDFTVHGLIVEYYDSAPKTSEVTSEKGEGHGNNS